MSISTIKHRLIAYLISQIMANWWLEPISPALSLISICLHPLVHLGLNFSTLILANPNTPIDRDVHKRRHSLLLIHTQTLPYEHIREIRLTYPILRLAKSPHAPCGFSCINNKILGRLMTLSKWWARIEAKCVELYEWWSLKKEIKSGDSKWAWKFKFILNFEFEYRKHRTIKRDTKFLGLTMLRCLRNTNKPMRDTTTFTLHFMIKKRSVVVHGPEVPDM